MYIVQGNYDQFVRTRLELLENQMKQYSWEQDQIAHMKVSIFSIILWSLYHVMSTILSFGLELHCTLWTWISQIGSSGQEQGEDTVQDGCRGADREGPCRQDCPVLLSSLWHNPSSCYYGPGESQVFMNE